MRKLLILVFVFSSFLFAQDLREDFPSIRNQFSDTCYAFSLADLYNYELRKAGYDKLISPYSIALSYGLFSDISSYNYSRKYDGKSKLVFAGAVSFNAIPYALVHGFYTTDDLPFIQNSQGQQFYELMSKAFNNLADWNIFQDAFFQRLGSFSQNGLSIHEVLKKRFQENSHKDLTSFFKKFHYNRVFFKDRESYPGSLTVDEVNLIKEKIESLLRNRKPIDLGYYSDGLFLSPEIFYERHVSKGANGDQHVVILVGMKGSDYIMRNSWGLYACEENRMNYRSIPTKSNKNFNKESSNHVLADILHKIQSDCGGNIAYPELLKGKPVCYEYLGSSQGISCQNKCFQDFLNKSENLLKIEEDYRDSSVLEDVMVKLKKISDFQGAITGLNKPPFSCEEGHYIIPKNLMIRYVFSLAYLGLTNDTPLPIKSNIAPQENRRD